MTSLAAIVEDRLTTRESVVGANEPSLGNVAKHLFRFEAAALDVVSETDEARASQCLRQEAMAYHELLKAISRYESHVQSGAVVQETCEKEIEHYAKSASKVEDEITQTQVEIEELKSVLQLEQVRRAQKAERENLASLVNKHRTHADLEAELTALEKRLEKLDAESSLASEAVSMRQRQVRLLLASLQELKSMWEDGGEKEGTKEDRDTNMSLIEEDDDEEDEEERHGRGRFKPASQIGNIDSESLVGEIDDVEMTGDGIEDGEILE